MASNLLLYVFFIGPLKSFESTFLYQINHGKKAKENQEQNWISMSPGLPTPTTKEEQEQTETKRWTTQVELRSYLI
jgi:hypothetical protein